MTNLHNDHQDVVPLQFFLGKLVDEIHARGDQLNHAGHGNWCYGPTEGMDLVFDAPKYIDCLYKKTVEIKTKISNLKNFDVFFVLFVFPCASSPRRPISLCLVAS